MFVWDIHTLFAPAGYPYELRKDNPSTPRYIRLQSYLYHRSCVWDIQFIDSIFGGGELGGSHSGNGPASSGEFDKTSDILEKGGKTNSQLLLPTGTMVTCSTDGSIRFWNMGNDHKKQRPEPSNSTWKNPYSRDMLYSIDIQPNHTSESVSIDNSKHGSRKSYVPTATMDSSGLNASSNLSNLVLNTELPDRYQEESASRAFTIHPSHDHIACGDKFGVVRVYNIVTMLLVQTVHAHVAEILTMCYSPWMHYHPTLSPDGSDTETGTWNVNQTPLRSSNHPGPLLLLATAGRDRLIHVLDASIPGNYTPLITLDNHSASVTAIKFALDGRSLISCGGDKTIVFNEVNGPSIRRVKSVNTSHGTIMGLAIDATNKYVATTGQDKKLNIWNIKTGKFMRAYKHPDIQSELYKCDVDPSGKCCLNWCLYRLLWNKCFCVVGMYVAACTFDKKICIFDFFSGNLMTCIDSGHAELITAIRFSPNGKHLLTVGGDGCVMIWRMGMELVSSMQDRILELYTNVKHKQQEQYQQLLRSMESRVSMPLPPSVNESSSSMGSINQRSDFPPVPPAPFPNMKSSSSAGPSHPAGGRNQWAARASKESSYELFGKNIPSSADASNAHKLTLELTADAYLEGNEITPTKTSSPPHSLSSSVQEKNRVPDMQSASVMSALTASTIWRIVW